MATDKQKIRSAIRIAKEMEKNLGFWRDQLDKRKTMAENPDWTDLKRSIYPLTMKEQHQNLFIIKYEILVSFAGELAALRKTLEFGYQIGPLYPRTAEDVPEPK